MHNLRPAHNYQPPPKAAQVSKRLKQPLEIKELRLAVGSMIMVHRSFGESEPGILEALNHFYADRSAGRTEAHSVIPSAAHEPEITVDVPDLYPERQPHQPTIDPPYDDSMKRIGAAYLIA